MFFNKLNINFQFPGTKNTLLALGSVTLVGAAGYWTYVNYCPFYCKKEDKELVAIDNNVKNVDDSLDGSLDNSLDGSLDNSLEGSTEDSN